MRVSLRPIPVISRKARPPTQQIPKNANRDSVKNNRRRVKQPKTIARKVKTPLESATCCICLRNMLQNALLRCVSCNIAVHRFCFIQHFTESITSNQKWTCALCVAKKKKRVKSKAHVNNVCKNIKSDENDQAEVKYNRKTPGHPNYVLSRPASHSARPNIPKKDVSLQSRDEKGRFTKSIPVSRLRETSAMLKIKQKDILRQPPSKLGAKLGLKPKDVSPTAIRFDKVLLAHTPQLDTKRGHFEFPGKACKDHSIVRGLPKNAVRNSGRENHHEEITKLIPSVLPAMDKVQSCMSVNRKRLKGKIEGVHCHYTPSVQAFLKTSSKNSQAHPRGSTSGGKCSPTAGVAFVVKRSNVELHGIRNANGGLEIREEEIEKTTLSVDKEDDFDYPQTLGKKSCSNRKRFDLKKDLSSLQHLLTYYPPLG